MISFVWHSQKDRTIMMEMGIARVRVGQGVTKGKVLRSFGADVLSYIPIVVGLESKSESFSRLVISDSL